MDSQFKITSLESSVLEEIQKIRQENGLIHLTIRQDLYTAALNHIRSIGKNNNTLNGNIETREKMFWNAKQYTEINFVTKPCESDPLQTIISIIRNHFISQITSQINSVGPAIVKLKSNRYIVCIFCAYFNPKISLRELCERIPDIKTTDQPSSDFVSLIDLINRLRELIPYQPFDTKENESTDENQPVTKSFKKSFKSKTSSELFCSLLSNSSFFNLITRQWTNFSYSSYFIDPNYHLKLNFYNNDEKYVYEVILRETQNDKSNAAENDNANKEQKANENDDIDEILELLND